MKAPLKILLSLLIVAGFVFFLTWQMLSLAESECRLCIEFNGRKECPTAHGPDDAAALDEAHRNACAILASGVTETLACNRQERTEVSCQVR